MQGVGRESRLSSCRLQAELESGVETTFTTPWSAGGNKTHIRRWTEGKAICKSKEEGAALPPLLPPSLPTGRCFGRWGEIDGPGSNEVKWRRPPQKGRKEGVELLWNTTHTLSWTAEPPLKNSSRASSGTQVLLVPAGRVDLLWSSPP